MLLHFAPWKTGQARFARVPKFAALEGVLLR
jgi:hypothetical protein